MPFTASQFESDAVAEPSEEEKEQQRLAEANAAVQELGEVLARRRREQGGTLTASEPGLLSRIRTSDFGRRLFGPTREEREAMVAQQPGLLEIPQAMLKFTTAPPQITEPIREVTEPVISQLAPVPAGVARGVRDVAIGALGSLPAGALMAPRLVAAPFAAEYASTLPEQFQAIREAETPGEAALALTTTGLGAGLTIAGAGEALRPQRRVAVEPQERPIVLEPERIQDADQIRIAEEVLPALPQSAEQVPQEVSAQAGAERVSPPTRQTVQEEVLLREEAPAPTATEAGAEVIPAAETVPPKTAVFNGIQMAGPSFKYFNEKTGRWNDVSAETAAKRGIEIPPEELAKAEAAVKPAPPAVLPEAIELAKQHPLPELERLGAEAKEQSAKARADYEATKATLAPMDRLEALGTLQPLALKAQAFEEALLVKQNETKAAQTKSQTQPGMGEGGQGAAEAGVGLRIPVRRSDVPEVAPIKTEVSVVLDPAPSGQALGIVPPGTGKLQEIINRAISKPKEVGPPIKTETDTPLPDFQEHATSKQIFSQPFGFERLPFIGALFGGTRRLTGHVNESLSTYWAERQIGRSIASAFGSEYSWINKPFTIKDGQITNITPRSGEVIAKPRDSLSQGKLVRLKDGSEAVIENDAGPTISIQKPSGEVATIPESQIWWSVMGLPEPAPRVAAGKTPTSRYISDVFEALQEDPNSWQLNPEQRKAFDAIQKLEADFTRLEKRYKIGKGVDDEAANPAELLNDTDATPTKGPYFPRIVTSRPEGVATGLTRGSSVGAKAFFEKPRLFDTEAEGWARGYKYEPDIVNRLATRAERLYKRIADKRLADDPSLEGVSRKEVEAQLKASFAEELVSGEMTEKKISQMADSIEARGRVYSPAFFNKIFQEETANQLNKAFPRSQSGLRSAAASINNALKGLQLGLDLGVGFIQGQALLARHPAIWAKAQFNSLSALFHVEQFPNYVRNNLEPVRELAQLGSGVGRLEEYMAGLGGRELLSKVPGVKGFGRQFQTFLDVAKVEMWKAYRETTPREQWPDVAQTLESVLSSGRMEAVGISQNRAMSERALLLAPSYYRGGLNMIAAMAEKGVSGQIARRAMTAYATAGAVLFYGLGRQLGMSDKEIAERMNPARSDFMLWRIKTEDRISNVGFGGFYRSLLRLMGNIAKTSLEHPENWKSLDPNKNPITKWYRGHAGPVVQQVWDQFSGKDYLGEDADLSTVRRAITPLALEALRKRPGQPSPTTAEVAQTFVGLQGYPATSKSELNKVHRDWLAKNEDPKVKADFERRQKMSFPSSKYADLNSALVDKNEKAITQAIADLKAEGVKRSDIFKRMSPYTVSGESQKPLFHETAALESKFRKSLTPEQMKLYEQAKKDRLEQWRLFLKLWKAE